MKFEYIEIDAKHDMLYCILDGDNMNIKNQEKVICPCYGITKADMIQAIEQGVTKFKDYQTLSNIGKDCSSCRDKNKERFKKYKRKLGIQFAFFYCIMKQKDVI